MRNDMFISSFQEILCSKEIILFPFSILIPDNPFTTKDCLISGNIAKLRAQIYHRCRCMKKDITADDQKKVRNSRLIPQATCFP